MTAQQIAQRANRRVKRAPIEFRKTMRGIGVSAVGFGKMKMTAEIYAIPEDEDPTTGKKKWTRTHKLLNGEKWRLIDDYTVEITNTAPYAKARHEAGKPGARKINPLRVSHWRDELVTTFRPLLKDALQVTIRDIMRTP